MSTTSTPTKAAPRHKRALTGLISTSALLAAAGTVAFLAGGGTASAAPSTADLSVSQHISGSTTTGSTVDTVTIHNAGSATATSINLSLFLKTASTGWSVHANHGTCQIAPAPSGFRGFAACQLGSLAKGKSIVETITWHGATGVAFSSFATVGASSPADPKVSNNSSTVSSYFGPRADLVLSGTAVAGKTAGTATAVTTVTNRGPNTAKALQLIVEIKTAGFKSVGVGATPLSSCQMIPAASGYNAAVSCVTNSLGTGGKWVLTFSYKGAKGATLTMKSTTSANTPADPVKTNNALTKSTKFKA